MKRLISAAAAVMIVLTMAGCSLGKTGDKEKRSGKNGDAVNVQDLPEIEPAKGIATISIVTDDAGAEDSLDFITKTVSSHISEMQASWYDDYVIPPEPVYKECSITLYDENAKAVSEGLRGNVKVRGNWTTTYDKKPLRIKFDEKQSVLGLNDGAEAKNWLLLASYKDGSML